MMPLFNFFLIDDSSFDLFIYKKLLVKSGIAESVKTFSSAREALKNILGRDSDSPDLVILLDLQMPDMNGFEFIDEFDKLSEAIQSQIRIFMLSSTIDIRDIEKAKASPHILDLLPKPLEIDILKSYLNI